jgi:hypothetical protein
MASSVVKSRGAKLRDPILIVTIYCLPSLHHQRVAVQFKYLVLAMLALILISLGKALYHLTSARPDNSARMVKALAWRIGLSVALFVLLIAAYYSGWIHPAHMAPGYSQ